MTKRTVTGGNHAQLAGEDAHPEEAPAELKKKSKNPKHEVATKSAIWLVRYFAQMPGWARMIGKAVGALVFLLGLVASVIGIASGWVALIPRVSVSQNQALDPSNPFTTPFIVSNDGPLPLKQVTIFCGIRQVQIKNGPTIVGDENYGTRFIETPNYSGPQNPPQTIAVGEMKPGERATVPCVFPSTAPISNVDVGIAISFKDWLHLRRSETVLRFVTLPGSDGRLYWYPEPANQASDSKPK